MIAGEEKLTKKQRDRLAYIYIRQSSPAQVRHNVESQERQYELKAMVESLGWTAENIVVLDEDQGHSGDGTHERDGFTNLRTGVCEGRIGIIVSIETNRLARSNREWHQLLDFCAVCETVVAEPGRIYDPRDYNDRLQLGLKGLMSEAELFTIRQRLIAGARHKAEKGKLRLKLPVGLVYGPDSEVQLDPDEKVCQTVRSILEKLPELGSARKVCRWLLDNDLKLPRRVGADLFSKVVWERPRYEPVLNLLRNPRYAGAYVFGKSEAYLRFEAGEPRRYRRRLSPEQWKVVLPGVHAGYISWEQFLSNRERLVENYSRRKESLGAPGRGEALLPGLIRCGKCAARMQVRYRRRELDGGKLRQEIYYHCSEATAHHMGPRCQRVGARVVDQLVREAFFRALEPAQLEVSVDMLKKLEESSRAAERQRELSLERCRYEVEKAQRQYDQVEPENRLVARTLERRWEERLKEQKCAEAELARWKRERNQVWSAGEILELQELIRDVPALWQAETSTNEDRKELLRLLIEEVRVWTGREKREVEVRIHWKGGSQTVHRARRSTGGHQLSEAAISRIRELAALGLSDRSIASELNAEGLRRSDGRNFVGHNVTHIRADYHIEQSSPPREPDIYNLKEAAALLGLSSQGLSDWLKDDDFEAERVQGGKEWKIRLTEKDIARLKRRWSSENEWTISQVAKFLGCTKQKVYRWIKNGKFRARRMIIGRRERWLISVEQVKDLKP